MLEYFWSDILHAPILIKHNICWEKKFPLAVVKNFSDKMGQFLVAATKP